MLDSILFALWFFLPAGVANVTPVLVAKTPGLSQFNSPMDLGKQYRGKRILGSHKTLRGLIFGVILGSLIFWLQTLAYQHYDWAQTFSNNLDYTKLPIILGALLSLGALAGDAIESFFKRQIDVPSGESWFPFDQTDYILGGCILSLFVVRLALTDYLLIIVVWFGMHLLFSYIGYLLRLKDAPL